MKTLKVLCICLLLPMLVQAQYTGGQGSGWTAVQGIPPVFDCPALSANIGNACDDGDVGTWNDVVMESCTCVGMPITIVLFPNIILEGPYNPVTGLMSDALRANGLLPLEEPYTTLGYFHIGGGGDEQIITSVLSITGPNAIVDWVVVELRDPDYNGFRVDSRSALLQRDGDVVDMDGISPVTFTTTPGTDFLSVKHRNHLGVMSAAPISFGSGITTMDFTAASTAAFGTAARKLVDGRLVLWTGDATFNGQMKYTGAANDRDPILVRIGSILPNNTTSGYFREDTNMDGIVKYTGTGNDRDPILVNVGSTTPNSVRNGQVP